MEKMTKIFLLIYFLINLNSCWQSEHNREITICEEPIFNLCWISGTRNNGEISKIHYLEIANYKETCFNSYNLLDEAIRYVKTSSDSLVSKVGFCTKCSVKPDHENSEKWGAVREKLLFTVKTSKYTNDCIQPRIEKITYFNRGIPHDLNFEKIIQRCK